MSNEGQKTVSAGTESRMQRWATIDVKALVKVFPQAREIDLLNAYLKVFTERVSEGGHR